MTASEMTGQPADAPIPANAPDAGPAGTDELPPQAESRGRRRKIVLLFILLVSFAALLGVAIWYLLYRQPIPLPVVPTSQIPTYATSVYGVSRPVGIAVTADGSRLFVAQSFNDRIVKALDASGAAVGTLDPGDGSLDHVPVYVAMDPLTGEVYVSDRLAGAIYVYDKNNVFQRQFVAPAELGAWQPLGMAFDAAGNLYVTNLTGPASVVVFDRSGAMIRNIGAAEELNFPNGVAVDKDGYVYVTDSNNGRVLVFSPDGAVVARVGRGADAGKLGLPRGIAIDPEGRVFVVDTTGQGVAVYRTYQSGSQRLEYLGSFGAQGISDGQFSFPNGVALDSRGHVYVTDSSNDRVQVWGY